MEQINIFSGSKPFKVDKPIRLIELFAGIGAQAKALERMGVEFEHYRICEFDKYAVTSYNAVHRTNFDTSDITKITADDLAIVDTDTYCYICCYSFPCQDLSTAGKQKLMAKGSGTRSSLLWEVGRLLDECAELPQVLLMENVTQVHGKKNADSFRQWCDKLESLGYKNYWQDLNAKDFGVPQNRNRTFMVSLLGDYNYEFPEGFPLEIKLADVLEDEVDEKYYLSPEAVAKIMRHKNKIIENDTPEVSATIHAGYYKKGGRDQQYVKTPCVIKVGNIYPSGGQNGNVYDINGISPTILSGVTNTRGNGGIGRSNAPKVLVWDGFNQRVRADSSVIGTLTQNCGADLKRNGQGIIYCDDNGEMIRSLTPTECFRLMGFTDEDFEKAEAVNSNTQLYKQAGNSIVVDVLMAIFSKLF